MGSKSSSLIDGPAGLSVIGNTYKTTRNVIVECMGWSTLYTTSFRTMTQAS